MQPTTLLKSLKNETTPQAKALVVIDLGNGQVKALLKAPGATKWVRVAFPSYVAETEQSNSRCIKVYTADGFKNYLVGEQAAAIPMSHTGKSETGKAANAKVLLLHALRLAFGDDMKSIHCEVIFTSPSNKAYGSEISAQLQNVHPVTIPADAEVIGSEAKSYTVVVHRAIPQLEGHYAFNALNLKDDAWIIDCGNRTLIATKVRLNGGILKRKYFVGVGVLGMAERITAREALVGFFKEHSPERVIEFLLGQKQDASVAAEIAADVSVCIAEALAFCNDSAPRFLIGGGAGIPGLSALLNAKPVKDPQWVNIAALADIADDILGSK